MKKPKAMSGKQSVLNKWVLPNCVPSSLHPPFPPFLTSFFLTPLAFSLSFLWCNQRGNRPNCLSFQTLREIWVLPESQYWNRADYTITYSFYDQILPGLICPQYLATTAAPPLESFFSTVSRVRILSPDPIFSCFIRYCVPWDPLCGCIY